MRLAKSLHYDAITLFSTMGCNYFAVHSSIVGIAGSRSNGTKNVKVRILPPLQWAHMSFRPHVAASVPAVQRSYQWGNNISRRDSGARSVQARDVPDRLPAPRRVRHGSGPAPLACTPYSR